MISLTVVFYLFVVLFAIIGGMRGWAKELLVSFSIVLALFIIFILMQLDFTNEYVKSFEQMDQNYGYISKMEGEEIVTPPPLDESFISFDQIGDENHKSDYRRQFWIRTFIVGLLAFFGYQTPAISRIGSSARREKVQDFLFGLVLGAVNGYLIVGTLWSYMHSAHYPFTPYIVPSTLEVDPLIEAANRIINVLPPVWLGVSPWVYLAVGAAFLFVLVVFI